MIQWQPTNMIDPQELVASRLLLHYAIQLVAILGNALAEWQEDASHASLEWSPQQEVFRGQLIKAKQPLRGTLEPLTLRLVLVDVSDRPFAVWSLLGQTLEQGMTWLKPILDQRGAKTEKLKWIEYPPDFPTSPLAEGAAFAIANPVALQTLVAYFANSQALLQSLAETLPGASPLRIWPHHFDLATLVSLPGQNQGESPSIGLGFSPGDHTYNQPYWYVTPWPYPGDRQHLPSLAGGGQWHTQDWVGAILLASDLGSDPAAQVQAFLDSAYAAAQTLLLI